MLNRLENLQHEFFSAGLKITTTIRPRFRCATNRKLLQTHKQMQLQHGSCDVLAVSVEEVDSILAFEKREERKTLRALLSDKDAFTSVWLWRKII